MIEEIAVRTTTTEEFIDVPEVLPKMVRRSGVAEGVRRIFVLHTPAAVTINEHADPDGASDIAEIHHGLVPAGRTPRHL